MSFGEEDAPGWTALKRSDGLRITLVGRDRWGIQLPPADATVTVCPCCKRPLMTARAAQLVANAIHPIKGSK